MKLLAGFQSLSLLGISVPVPSRVGLESVHGNRPAKAPKVHFQDCISEAARRTHPAGQPLSYTKSLPKATSKYASYSQPSKQTTPSETGSGVCSLYLESCELTHETYPVKDYPRKILPALRLDETLKLPWGGTLTVPERIDLALQLAKGVLQFQSTPWWLPLWQLRDLGYFLVDDGLASSIRTLHINSNPALSGCMTQLQPDTTMRNASQEADDSGLDDFDSLDYAKEHYGICNKVLYNLGAALLQIGVGLPWIISIGCG